MKNRVKNIQTAGYNGARTVIVFSTISNCHPIDKIMSFLTFRSSRHCVSAALQRAEEDNESLQNVDPGVIGLIPPSHPNNEGQILVRTYVQGVFRIVDNPTIETGNNTTGTGNDSPTRTGNNSPTGTGNGGGLGESSSPPVVVGNLRNVLSGPPRSMNFSR